MPIKETNKGRFFAYCDPDNEKRTASMFFRKPIDEDKWTFKKCEINLIDDPYSLQDWKFLGEISEEIEKRLSDLNK